MAQPREEARQDVGLRLYLESFKKKKLQQHLIYGIQRAIGQKEPAGGAGAGSNVRAWIGLWHPVGAQRTWAARRALWAGHLLCQVRTGSKIEGVSLGPLWLMAVSYSPPLLAWQRREERKGGRDGRREGEGGTEERITYEKIMHSGPRLPHPCPCGRLWKVSHSEMKEVYVTRVSTRTFWCALGGLLLPLHPPLALWPPGPGQTRVVPSPPTVGVQKEHKAMGRDTLTLSCQGLLFRVSQMSRDLPSFYCPLNIWGARSPGL